MYHVGQWIMRHKIGAVALMALGMVAMSPDHGGTGLFAPATPPAPQPVAEVPVQQAVQPQVVEAPVGMPDDFYDDSGEAGPAEDLAADDSAVDVQPDLVPEPATAEPDLVVQPQ